MQLIERFRAEANDGRVVEILGWGSGPGTHDEVRGHAHTIYATVDGWRCHPTADGSYIVAPAGVNVRRIA